MADPGGAADWELSKENYQPLRQGRDPTAASAQPAQLVSGSGRDDVEKRRREYWEQIAGYEGDDPLEVWLRFIKWTQDTFAAGGHQAELLPLLERCTRELQGAEKYKQDARYLRVWLQYADCLPEPRDVFLFMKENEIGQDFALYYIAYASFLELRGAFAKADAVYVEGINRLASPIERLKQKHVEFQHRMARRIQRKAQQEAEAGPAGAAPERATLGVIKQKKSVALLGRASSAAAGGESGSQDDNGAGGFEVYQDEDLGGPGAAPVTGTAGWARLGSYESSRKENVQKAGVWAGTRLPQKAASSAPAAPELEVYVDEELLAQQQDSARSAAAAAPSQTLRQRLDDAGPGGLYKDPLALHKDPAAAAAAAGGAAAPTRAAASAAPPPPSKKPSAKGEPLFAWAPQPLQAADGSETTFEECRAAAWLLAHGAPSPCPATADAHAVATAALATAGGSAALPALSPVLEGSREGLSSTAGGRATPSHDSSALTCTATGARPTPPEVQQPLPAAAAAAQHSGASHGAYAAAGAGAGAGIGGGLHAGGGGDVGRLAGAQHPALARGPAVYCGDATMTMGVNGFPEPTVTINTAEALSAVNQLFAASLPHEHGHLPSAAYGGGACGASGLGPEPTVTISTKEAFAAINSLFASDLACGGADGGSGSPGQGVRGGGGGHPALDGGGSLEVYEDTQLLGGGPRAPPGELGVYEDTELLGGAGQQLFALQLGDREQGGSLEVYEDTNLLGGGGAPDLQVHEDTALLGQQAAAGPGAPQVAGPKAGLRPAGGGAAGKENALA